MSRPFFGFPVGASLSIVLLLATAHLARADDHPLDLTITNATFEIICDYLELNEDQRVLAREAFLAYREEIDAHRKQTRKRVDDAGWSRFVALSEAHRGRETEESWAEIDVHMRAARNERAACYRESDQLLQALYDEFAVLVSDEQVSLMDRLPTVVRIAYAFSRRPSAGHQDFAVLVNIRALAAAAMDEGGEFAPLQDDVGQPGTANAGTVLRALEGRLRQWENELDAMIANTLAERRKRVAPDTTTVIQDEDRVDDLIRSWTQTHDAAARAATEIGAIVAPVLGHHAQSQWFERWRAATCPDLYADRVPDDIHEWFETAPDVEVWERDAERRLYEEYVRRRRQHREAAFSLGVAVKREYVSLQGNEEEQLEYKERIDRLRGVVTTYLDALRNVVRPDRGAVIDSYEERARMYHPHKMGPRI